MSERVGYRKNRHSLASQSPNLVEDTAGARPTVDLADTAFVGVRLVVAKADDAPAPSIVICGLDLLSRPPRSEVAGWMAPARAAVMADHAKLGAKTIVLLRSPNGLEVEFFQGLADGSYDLSAETCVNSAACAASAAVLWQAADDVVDIQMAGATYRFEAAR